MRNKYLPILGAAALLCGSILSSASATEQDQEFKTLSPMSVSQFESEIASKASDITLIELVVQVPGQLDSQTFGSLGTGLTLDSVVKESLITLADMKSSVSDESTKTSIADLDRYSKIEAKLRTKSFKVGSAEGKSKSKLWDTTTVNGRPEKVKTSSTASAKSTPVALAASAVPCGIWRPNFHANIAASSTYPGQRYDQLKFAFTQGQLDAFSCTGSTGFEPDLVTDNYDTFHYFGDSIVSFSSTMPYSYLDTNFMDAPEERVYTVGTYNIAAASPWTEYTSYVRTPLGNADSDRAKVVWQRNSERVPGCSLVLGAAWCLFSDESKTEYAWKFPLPGTYLAP
jgi:hypothetical protein